MDLAQDSPLAFQKAKVALCHLLATAFGLRIKSSQGNLSGLGELWGRGDLGGSEYCLCIEPAVFEVLQKLSLTATLKKSHLSTQNKLCKGSKLDWEQRGLICLDFESP